MSDDPTFSSRRPQGLVSNHVALPAQAPRTPAVNKRIMLVVPGRLFRNGIERVLQAPDRLIIGDCESLEEVEATLDAQPHPDLFVIGIAGPECAGAAFARIRALRAKMPDARWIVLSRSVDLLYLREAIASGIEGMLLEDSPGEALQLLAELVMLGHSFVPVELAKALAGELPPAAPAAPDSGTSSGPGTGPSSGPGTEPMRIAAMPQSGGAPDHAGPQSIRSGEGRDWHTSLSDREKEILHCLIAGHPNKLIARELRIAEATVKVHVKALLRKMQVANRTQAAISALQFLRSTEGATRPARVAEEPPPVDEPERATVLRETTAAILRLARSDVRPDVRAVFGGLPNVSERCSAIQ